MMWSVILAGFVLLLGGEERECHVGWLCAAAGQWGSVKRARNGYIAPGR